MTKASFIQDAMHILNWSATKASAFYDLYDESKCREVLNKKQK